MTDFFAAAHRAQTTHGEAVRGAWTPTYRAWRYMRDRVARDPDYALVLIDLRWNDYESFKADMGEQPEGKTLDRVDGALVYSKATCRWATPKEQANNKTTNVRITRFGRTQTLAEWAAGHSIVYKTVYSRIYQYGWSIERALTTPHRGWNKQGRVS